jgi:hypothetical protein
MRRHAENSHKSRFDKFFSIDVLKRELIVGLFFAELSFFAWVELPPLQRENYTQYWNEGFWMIESKKI